MAVDISPPLREDNRGKKVAVVVGGGPAPGINGVIRGVALEAMANGMQAVGLRDGYKWLVQGSVEEVVPLTEQFVERIHLQGGSVIGTSREAPARDDNKMTRTIASLRALEVDHLVSIGGDDTASTASAIGALTGNEITVVHVPKTIDNDLPLPNNIPTFGYQTAREVGAGLVNTLLEDARTTGRWYFVVAMGRSAGHLALGIGKASDAAVTIIPEQFRGQKVSITDVCNMLEGSILKCAAGGRHFGVAVIAEGVA